MTPELWRRVQEVFARAIELEPDRRAEFLDGACGQDDDLRAEVDSMVAVYAQAESSSTADPAPELTAVAGEARELAAAMADAARAVSRVGSSGVPRSAAARLSVGMVVDGKYRVEGTLGAGGMGTVYLAADMRLQRQVALKVIRGDLLADAVTAERFRREALAVARLRHPNIVTVYDYNDAEGVGAYLVMELLDGRSLRGELADRDRLDVREALDLMAPVCEAVGAAHRAGVIHRDLKPDNIFVERRDGATAVKVLDFGIAKLSEASPFAAGALTTGGVAIGTPAYMSPEQCRGESADERSDVYALGCMLYEMVTGRAPFPSSNAVAVLYDHVNTAPRRPSDLVPGIATSLDEALVRALAKAPNERFQTAHAFARALGIAGAAGAPDTGSLGAITAGSRLPPDAVRVVDARTPNNVPRAATRFIGRERQIADVTERLARDPLVTLAGPGGIGKSRLALAVASAALEAYPDGVWLAELAALSDPTLVLRTVAVAVGVPSAPGLETFDALRESLRDKRVLLLLDNCEHLVDACAELVERLVRGCPRLSVLTTSREPLGIAGEAVWQVPPLSAPDAAMGAEEALACEAVRMFADRAALSRAGFSVTESVVPAVAALCRRLEGIPLALELAAARAKVLSVEQILAKLEEPLRLLTGGSRTSPPRQQTLRATLDWSYDLLTEDERSLLRRLATFAGGWTLSAADAVVGSWPTIDSDEPRPSPSPAPGNRQPATDLLDLLSRLVDKSLVIAHDRGREARFRMLETIREYGLERLLQSGEGHEARRRHAAYFLAEAEVARIEIRSGRCTEWLEVLEDEHANVRAALGWLLEHDPDRCLLLAAAVNKFRILRGHLAEARRWMEAALVRAHAAPARDRVSGLLQVGSVAIIQGDFRAARAFYEQGVLVARDGGSAQQSASLAHGLGELALKEGDLRAARAYFGECLTIGRETETDLLVGISLNGLGEIARLEGEWDTAGTLYEQVIAIARQVEHEPFLSLGLCNLAAVEFERGETDAAEVHYSEALRMAQAMRSDEYIGLSLDGLGAIATRRGAAVRAARLAGAAEALLDAVGAVLDPTDRGFRDRYLAGAREQSDEEQIEAALAEGRAMTPECAIEYALSTGDEGPSV